MELLLSKVIDWTVDSSLKFLVNVAKVIAPVKISPRKIIEVSGGSSLKNIFSMKIENRLRSDLFNIFVAGISKEPFSVKIVSDDGPKGKTVERMDVNTNHLAIHATDKRSGNHLWLFRIHKFTPKEVLNLRLKIENRKAIYFKTLDHSPREVFVKERDDGVIYIPFPEKELVKKLR